MRGCNTLRAATSGLVVLLTLSPMLTSAASAQTALPGKEEFGLNEKELVQAVEKVEAQIAKCMREQGFEYVAADYRTVRKGMSAIMTLPGVDEEEFIEKHGYGIATLYTGAPPQSADGYSPAKVGLGQRNVEIYQNLSVADRAAYNRALFGENTDASFAVALDIENFSRCGGCTQKAIEAVFKPDQVKATYVNPKDALIRRDPRMKAAIAKYAAAMRKEGFEYNDPEEVENDLRQRLYAITGGGIVPVASLSTEQKAALARLQELERKVAVINLELEEDVIEPVEEKIEKEIFARQDN